MIFKLLPIIFLSLALLNFKMVQNMDKKAYLTLFDFLATTETKWNTINDVVMGGVSKSSFNVLPDSTALFSGEISLDNYGGFASVRTSPKHFNLKKYEGIIIRIKGDGKCYDFRIRTDEEFDGIAYKAEFDTEKDQWMEIRLPFSSFKPTFRGRELKNAPDLATNRIYQLGFLIADKQEGKFSLYIDWIKAYRPAS